MLTQLRPVLKYYMTSEAGNVETETADQEKDLDDIVDSKLQFRHHTASKVSTANRNLGIIFSTFTYLSQWMFLSLYKSIHGETTLEICECSAVSYIQTRIPRKASSHLLGQKSQEPQSERGY